MSQVNRDVVFRFNFQFLSRSFISCAACVQSLFLDSLVSEWCKAACPAASLSVSHLARCTRKNTLMSWEP